MGGWGEVCARTGCASTAVSAGWRRQVADGTKSATGAATTNHRCTHTHYNCPASPHLRQPKRHSQVVQALRRPLRQVDQQRRQARPRLELLCQQAAAWRGVGQEESTLEQGAVGSGSLPSTGSFHLWSTEQIRSTVCPPAPAAQRLEPHPSPPPPHTHLRSPCAAAAGPLEERLPAGAAPPLAAAPSSSSLITSAISPSK